jgi:hypothetical protein
MRPSFRDYHIDDETDFIAEIIDTWNMTIRKAGIHKGAFRLELPAKQYIAVRLRRPTEDDYLNPVDEEPAEEVITEEEPVIEETEVDVVEEEEPAVEEETFVPEEEVMQDSMDDTIIPEPEIENDFISHEDENNELTDSNIDYLTTEDKEPEVEEDENAELKKDIKSVLLYMDQLLENLPEEKIVEFAKSDEFTTYKKLFSELGLS